MGAVYLSSELLKLLEPIRGKKKIVFTNGCFDLLHIGHVRYLKEARSLGEFLVVGINSDSSVKQLKGPSRPIQTELDRAEILASLASVDATIIFNESTPELLIQSIKPDILVKGGDWTVDQIVGGAFVQSYGGKVLSLQFIEGKSTTRLVEKSSQK
ncbi:MAG: D-glycero-beta-D-manno-heptose 1-phosphate adenylyltransferase [Deltaproteobacteria bacterium]|jgi:rfaE bifunctional protein nucleotidyltransferase chain/domain|nr:D-glycero-beta-D-manno-heptose 1-phosphate adenylyltransferase [Deltaproteobacteria bacterium]